MTARERPEVRLRQQGFRTERTLVTHFVVTARKQPSAHLRLTWKEFDATNGVTDIIQVRLRRNWRANVALGKILPRWAYALRQIPYRRSFSTESFVELSGTTRKTALTILRRFAELKYCVRARRKGEWMKWKQPIPLVNEIVAIEAKLRDWKRALAQADRHLDYAHRSWVLLDASRATRAIENLDKFKRLNVGLITQLPGQRPKVWFTPEKRTPRSGLRYWQANSELGRRLIFQVGRVITVDDI